MREKLGVLGPSVDFFLLGGALVAAVLGVRSKASAESDGNNAADH